MEVVAPAGVEPVAAGLRRSHQPRIVEVALGDRATAGAPAGRRARPPRRPAPRGGGWRSGRRRRARRRCAARRRGSARASRAALSIEEAAHLVAAGAVEVHGLAPRRAVAVGEVRAEAGRGGCPTGRGGCRRRRAPRPGPGRGRRRPGASAPPARRRRGGGRTRSTPSYPQPRRPGNSATGISSTAFTPRSTRWSRCSTTPSKVPARAERADVQLVEHRGRPAAGRASRRRSSGTRRGRRCGWARRSPAAARASGGRAGDRRPPTNR